MAIKREKKDTTRKKVTEKYILHKKINASLTGVELFNSKLSTPFEVYLSCRLELKKDVYSLAEVEQVAHKIRSAWVQENKELHIKNASIVLSKNYITLTFLLGFFDKTHAKQLSSLKIWVQGMIENTVILPLIKDPPENDFDGQLEKILNKCNQINKRIVNLEEMVVSNESIFLESESIIKHEIAKANKQILERVSLMEENFISIINQPRNHKLLLENYKTKSALRGSKLSIKENVWGHRKYSLKKTRQTYVNMRVVGWSNARRILKKKEQQKIGHKKELYAHIRNLENEIMQCFSLNRSSQKKQLINKQLFENWISNLEYIDYLWALLEQRGTDDIWIANKISSKKLIQDLKPFLSDLEEEQLQITVLSRWVYCSNHTVIKLKGYTLLKEFLSNMLQLNRFSEIPDSI